MPFSYFGEIYWELYFHDHSITLKNAYTPVYCVVRAVIPSDD